MRETVYVVVDGYADEETGQFNFKMFGPGLGSLLRTYQTVDVKNSRGNPYGIYGPIYQQQTGRNKFDVNFVVAHLTSGSFPLNEKSCQHCGKAFTPKNNNNKAKFCGGNCRVKAHRDRQKETA